MSKPNINLKYREQDGMMLPDLQISNSSEADQPLGRYGRMALEYGCSSGTVWLLSRCD